MSVNKIILIGRLGRDPESRYTSGGQNVCNFSIAVDEQWKDRSGERQKNTTWFDIAAWGKLGEICQKYLKKGAQVYIEGAMQRREYEKDGQKRVAWSVRADVMRMLGDKKNGGNSDHAEAPEPAAVTDDDIPF